jgi:hypothetical protein
MLVEAEKIPRGSRSQIQPGRKATEGECDAEDSRIDTSYDQQRVHDPFVIDA